MTDEIERVAAALWREDAECINFCQVASLRTPEAFAKQDIHLRNQWRCLARAAIEAMQHNDTHASDCARHNAPAYEAGDCDCGADDGDMLTIAYLAGAHDAKRDLRPSGPPTPITVRGSSIAKDRPFTRQDAAKLLLACDQDTRALAWKATIDAPADFGKWFAKALRAIAGEDQT